MNDFSRELQSILDLEKSRGKTHFLNSVRITTKNVGMAGIQCQ